MAKQARYVVRYWPVNEKGKVKSHTMQMIELGSHKAVAVVVKSLERNGHLVTSIEDRNLPA